MGKMQRTKGSTYERKIAKDMTDWARKTTLAGADPDVAFSRTPMSGAWASTHRDNDTVIADIIAPQSVFFPYSVELKNHETVNLETVFHSNREMPSFWAQCAGDAIRGGLVPMLIMHRNRSADYVVLPKSDILVGRAKQANANYMVSTLRMEDKMLEMTFYFDIMVVELKQLAEFMPFDEFTANHEVLFSEWYDRAKGVQDLARLK